MVKCPYCGSDNVTAYKTPEGERGHYCYECKKKFKTFGDKILGKLTRRKKEKEEEEEEESKKSKRGHSIIPGILLLVGLVITFLIPMDHLTKTFIILGMTAYVIIVYGFFRFASFGFIILTIYLAFNLPKVQASLEEYGIYESIKSMQDQLCVSWCMMTNIGYSRTDPMTYCQTKCGVFQVDKQPGACTECLTFKKNEKIYPARVNESEIIDITLKMESSSKTTAKNVYVDVVNFVKDEYEHSADDISRCSISDKCEMEAGDEKLIVVTFDYAQCEGSNFKYKILLNYDFETGTDISFDLLKYVQEVSTVEKKSASTEGPLNIRFRTQKEYLISDEYKDKTVYLSLDVQNAGKGTIYLDRIEITQIPPAGYDELDYEEAVSGHIFANTNLYFSHGKIILENIQPLEKDERDTIILKFDLPNSLETSKLTYSFTAKAFYSYSLEKKFEIKCE